MKRLIAPMIAAAVALTPGLAAAKCFPMDLTNALEALTLKRELMVASLSCSGDMSSDYNRFVAQHGSALDGHSRRLQAHFRQAYGGQSESRFMKFDSALSNEISYKVMMNSNYCNEAVVLFSTVREMQQAQLIEVASTRPVPDNIARDMCAPPKSGQSTAQVQAPAPVNAAVQTTPAGAPRPR
jgi:hypothetical protein